MANALLEAIYFMISYVGIIVMFFTFLNFMTKGFFMKFLKVKASKGKKILTRVFSPTDIYYTTGEIEEGAFKYETRQGVKKTIVEIPEGVVYPTLSVFSVDVDETKDIFYTKQGTAQKGPSAAVIDSFINRAIVAPKPEDKFKVFVVIILIILMLIAIGTLATLFGVANELTLLKQLSGNI